MAAGLSVFREVLTRNLRARGQARQEPLTDGYRALVRKTRAAYVVQRRVNGALMFYPQEIPHYRRLVEH